MYQENRHRNPLIGYEYKEIIAGSDQAAMLVDCYENFGWIVEEGVPYEKLYHHIRIRMKRDRKLVNKMELTRLQRHFEACLNEIKSLELAKTRDATVCSMIVGIVGTAFLAGSVFSIIRCKW